MKWQKDAYKKTKNNFSKREGIQMIGRNKKAGILCAQTHIEAI